MRFALAGDTGILVDAPGSSASELNGLAAALRTLPLVVATIVGRESVLVLTDPATGSVERIAARVREVAAGGAFASAAETAGRVHRLRVGFDLSVAPDLPALLTSAAISRDTFLSRLGSVTFSARYLGFLAGFAYLDGLPPEWSLPRRTTPRPVVPAGSFAIAASTAGFYPIESPGGWNIIGRTDAVLWNPWRNPPNLMGAGDHVVVDPAEEALAPPPIEQRRLVGGPAIAQVTRPGQRTVIVGAASFERYRFGLPPGGPFDPEAAKAANRAAGNAHGAGVLELTLVGPELRFLSRRRCSYFGPDAVVEVNGAPIADPASFEVEAGARLSIGRLQGGARAVLAIDGGIASPAAPHAAEPHAIASGEIVRDAGAGERAGRRVPLVRYRTATLEARIGPHPLPSALRRLIEAQEWEVTPRLDRRAVRITAGARDLDLPRDLPSLGVQFGSVQWHPDGDLVLMGPDHPVTGGYLQPITIVARERWKIAMLSPGERVRFVLT